MSLDFRHDDDSRYFETRNDSQGADTDLDTTANELQKKMEMADFFDALDFALSPSEGGLERKILSLARCGDDDAELGKIINYAIKQYFKRVAEYTCN